MIMVHLCCEPAQTTALEQAIDIVSSDPRLTFLERHRISDAARAELEKAKAEAAEMKAALDLAKSDYELAGSLLSDLRAASAEMEADAQRAWVRVKQLEARISNAIVTLEGKSTND